MDERFEMGRVIGQTFSLVARNFVSFFLLSVLFFGLPYGGYLLVLWGTRSNLIHIDPSMATWLPLASGIISWLCALVLQGALTRASIDSLAGKGVSVGAAAGTGFRLLLPLIGLGILMGLGLGLGFLFLVIPGLILATRWVVSAPALVVEDAGVTGAMGRSAELTEDHRWAIFGLLIAFWIVSVGVGVGIGAASRAFSFGAFPWAFIALSTASETILRMFGTAGAAAIYFELKRIKEGLGVSDLASVFD